MKRQLASCAEPSNSSFPLFSQKGAGGSTPQVQAGKRLVLVSTDSQISSQQQGFIYLVSRWNLLQQRIVVVQIRAKWAGLRTELGSGHALIPMLLIRLALTPTSCAVTKPPPEGGPPAIFEAERGMLSLAMVGRLVGPYATDSNRHGVPCWCVGGTLTLFRKVLPVTFDRCSIRKVTPEFTQDSSCPMFGS